MSWKDTVKVNNGLLSSWTNMESVIIRVEVILGILSIWNNLTGYSMDSKSKGVHVCLAISRNYV